MFTYPILVGLCQDNLLESHQLLGSLFLGFEDATDTSDKKKHG